MFGKITDRSEKEDASGSITPCYGYKGRSAHCQHCFAMSTEFKCPTILSKVWRNVTLQTRMLGLKEIIIFYYTKLFFLIFYDYNLKIFIFYYV